MRSVPAPAAAVIIAAAAMTAACGTQRAGPLTSTAPGGAAWRTAVSTAMVPRADGHMMLMLGVTGGYFVADHQGVAVITATCSPCGPRAAPTGPATSHKMLCGDIQTFRVTVTVVG